MLKTQSPASKKREQQRTSPKTLEFKSKICSILEKARPEISYAIKRDLSIMTNMPFYKDRPTKIKVDFSPIELINEYAKFFLECEDKEFTTKKVK